MFCTRVIAFITSSFIDKQGRAETARLAKLCLPSPLHVLLFFEIKALAEALHAASAVKDALLPGEEGMAV